MSMALSGISQNSKDSLLPIPVSQLRTAMFLIEEGRVCKTEDSLTKQLVGTIVVQNVIKDSIILVHQKNEAHYKTVMRYYQDMNKNGEEVINNLDANLRIHQKLIKRQKFNKYLYAIAGFGIGFFLTK